MKATGIVRKVDELGRIVIPRELRKILVIKEGSPLEIFTTDEGEIVLKKYSLVKNLQHYTEECADTLYDLLNTKIIIYDKEEIVAVRGMSEKSATQFLLENRIQSQYFLSQGVIESINGKVYIEPIQSQGTVVGGIIALDYDELDTKLEVSIKSMATLLTKLMG